MQDPFHRPTLGAGLFYRDPAAALPWLERAFGLRTAMTIRDREGRLVHAEMRFGEAVVHVGGEFTALAASPASLNGKNTQAVWLMIAEGIEAHCTRARAAGAAIVRELEDQFYGDRTYTATDLEGHRWNFSQFVRAVTRAQAEAATGLKIEGWTEP